jgi:hypothetical protein
MPIIELQNGYVCEKLPDGFVFHENGPLDTESLGNFARACVELGHRLAKEGKQIAEVQLMRMRNPWEQAIQSRVKVKIKHVLANVPVSNSAGS